MQWNSTTHLFLTFYLITLNFQTRVDYLKMKKATSYKVSHIEMSKSKWFRGVEVKVIKPYFHTRRQYLLEQITNFVISEFVILFQASISWIPYHFTVCNFGDFHAVGRAEARTTEQFSILYLVTYLLLH